MKNLQNLKSDTYKLPAIIISIVIIVFVLGEIAYQFGKNVGGHF